MKWKPPFPSLAHALTAFVVLKQTELDAARQAQRIAEANEWILKEIMATLEQPENQQHMPEGLRSAVPIWRKHLDDSMAAPYPPPWASPLTGQRADIQ